MIKRILFRFDAFFCLNSNTEVMHKAGFVNIVGNPNVGKSTLMNVLVGERISIATFKAQTTRHRIMGIYNTDDMQIVFSDTPGVLKPNYKLQESMLNFSTSALTDADVLLYVTDVVETPDKHNDFVEKVGHLDVPVLLLINKIDLSNQEKLVELAANNAALVLSKDRERLKREEGRTIGAVREIEKLIGISDIRRMEAYDISNTNGFESVGSMVVYERGKPKRNDYRKFKIKGIEGADDYGSMREVLTRRFTHGLKEQKESKEIGGFSSFPDLILMDGGKGQVNVALRVLDHLGLDIPVCGMVKDDDHRTRGLYYNNEEIIFAPNSEAFLLVTRIQDEAHRFAIEYHRSLRAKGQVHSVLDDIKGVGPKRRKELMKYFKDLGQIKTATVTELLNVPGMNQSTAESIYGFFHDSKQ